MAKETLFILILQKLGKKEVSVITVYGKRMSFEVSEAKTGFVLPFVDSLCIFIKTNLY